MWKKKYDWRCPECGGQMYNCGSLHNDIKNSDFVLECYVCQNRFMGGDYTMEKASETNTDYLNFMQDREKFRESLGFSDTTNQIIRKEAVPVKGDREKTYVTLKDPVNGIDTFEVAWIVLEQTRTRTGNIVFGDYAGWDKVTRQLFNYLELNKLYRITVNFPKPPAPLTWREKHIYRCVQQPPHPPYISSIKGLILEENRVGKDRRPKIL
jgi:hypothetical protein